MSSVNKAILVGRLTKDPETRYMNNGKAVTSCSLATSEKYKDQEFTEYHNLVFFDKIAEIAGEYLKKGSLVYVEGQIKTEAYKDKNGVEKKVTKIVCRDMKMLGSKPANSQQSKQEETDQDDDSIPF